MIKTVFETEGLLGWTDDFNEYCTQILHFVYAEKFYIFNCTQLIQTTASTNAKAFYRERSFQSLMRLFYFYSGLKHTIESAVFGSDLNMQSIGELQQYMCGVFHMMLGKLEAYQFICPHIFLVSQKTKLIAENLIDPKKEVYCDTVVKAVETRVHQMY